MKKTKEEVMYFSPNHKNLSIRTESVFTDL